MFQLICDTCDNAKKYKGDKNIEKGSRSNLIVETESTTIVSCKLGLLEQPEKLFEKERTILLICPTTPRCKNLLYARGLKLAAMIPAPAVAGKNQEMLYGIMFKRSKMFRKFKRFNRFQKWSWGIVLNFLNNWNLVT